MCDRRGTVRRFLARWDKESLSAALGDLKVSAHVSEHPWLDFVNKNFKYEVMQMREFLSSAERKQAKTPYYYYRSQHAKRNKSSNLDVLGPLAEDFSLPSNLTCRFEIHSSVLRISSPGMRMWLHYDICDNFLCCIKGRKRVLMFPPGDVTNLYITGSSSYLGSKLLKKGEDAFNDTWYQFPLARDAFERRWEVELEEGDVLFIPALWPHCTEAVSQRGENSGSPCNLCISVNVFLLQPGNVGLHDPKDVWANRDLLPVQDALKNLEQKVFPALLRAPSRYRAFCCRQLAQDFLKMAQDAEQNYSDPQQDADVADASQEF